MRLFRLRKKWREMKKVKFTRIDSVLIGLINLKNIKLIKLNDWLSFYQVIRIKYNNL